MPPLNETLTKEIRAHGARDYPNETCGALLGLDGPLAIPAARLAVKCAPCFP